MLKKNIIRFIIWYIVLTILDKVFEVTLSTWVLVYNLGLTAFVCLFVDIFNAIFPPSAKKEE